MKLDKLTEATMLALRGKLNEVYIKEYVETFNDLYDSSWGPAIEVLDRISELGLEDDLMNWLEDLGTEDSPIDRTELNDYIIFQAEDIYDALGLDENGDPLDENKKLKEAKGSSKTYTCIEDRQHGDFCVGATMTAKEWGETAMGWADSDGWSDPEEPLLKNFKTEQDCINFIDDLWGITIVPSDSPEAKEFLGKKQEARSHKEANEKAAPRTVKNALGNDVETREMVDVSNPDVGNNSYKNEKGSQYWGTTHSEYASKRNKTGQKNEYGYDVYLAPFKNTGDWTIKADRMEPATATARYQYQKEQGELLKPDLKRYRDKEKRARNPENKEYWKNAADNIQRNIDDYDKKAQDIVNKERERIANKNNDGKKQEARSYGETENSELVIAKVFKNEDEAEKFIKENHIWTCNKHNFGIKGFVVIYDPSRSENKINYTSEIAEKERQDWLRKNGIK